MRRVALFGGSFNPPHVGHLMVVTWLLATGRADAVWLLPTGVHAFGKALAPFDERVRMIRAALSSLGLGRRVRVETIEGRSRGEKTYTIDTVRALKKKHPRTHFSLVIGTDILPDLPKWREHASLRKMVSLIVVRRAGVAGSDRDDPAHPSPLFPEVSSTEVRRRIAARQDVSQLVPEAALKIATRLYRGRGSS